MSVITLPPITQRNWTWPDWPSGLYEDSGGRHHFEGGRLDRVTFDECAAVVGEFNRPALLDDLADDGAIDLAWPEMAGVVATVWSASEYSESALVRDRWVALFRANGFSVDGQRTDRPAEAVRLFRSCVPTTLHFDNDRRLVNVDIYGRPTIPSDEVSESWCTTQGMSWTSNERRARRFARKYDESVFTAAVAPEHLLARVGDDVIVDPAGLTDVVSIDIAAVDR